MLVVGSEPRKIERYEWITENPSDNFGYGNSVAMWAINPDGRFLTKLTSFLRGWTGAFLPQKRTHDDGYASWRMSPGNRLASLANHRVVDREPKPTSPSQYSQPAPPLALAGPGPPRFAQLAD